jgi:APA family basic amino acid/polyamine antiporter
VTSPSDSSLIRGLGLAASTSVVVGSVIGTGIFLKSRVMMCNVESPTLMIAAWVVAGLLSLAGALTYAELAAMMPRAGGEYVFIREGYGRPLAFLYGWTQFAVAYSGSQAAKGAGFAIFLNGLLAGGLDYTFFTVYLFDHPCRSDCCRSCALGHHRRLGELPGRVGGWRISVVLTALKILIVVGVGLGAFVLARGSWGHFATSAAGAACDGVEATARGGLAGFGAALIGALWAYDGWTNGSIVAGEVRDPQRVLPIALIGGTLIVGALYVFANVSYLYVLSPVEIGNVSAASSVATEAVRQFLGPAAVALVAVAMMISTLERSTPAPWRRAHFAPWPTTAVLRTAARVSARARVPVNALLLQCVWSCAGAVGVVRHAHRLRDLRGLDFLRAEHSIGLHPQAATARRGPSVPDDRLSGRAPGVHCRGRLADREHADRDTHTSPCRAGHHPAGSAGVCVLARCGQVSRTPTARSGGQGR